MPLDKALKALGFDVVGVCVGVCVNGIYFCAEMEDALSIEPGLLLECECAACLVGCCGVAYCCAFVWNDWVCILGTEYPELTACLFILPPAGCRAPGRLYCWFCWYIEADG